MLFERGDRQKKSGYFFLAVVVVVYSAFLAEDDRRIEYKTVTGSREF